MVRVCVCVCVCHLFSVSLDVTLSVLIFCCKLFFMTEGQTVITNVTVIIVLTEDPERNSGSPNSNQHPDELSIVSLEDVKNKTKESCLENG